MPWFQYILVGLAAAAAGLVNALAGGGTLIAFPTLAALGIPTIAANVTCTVALVPGYLGGTLAQRADLDPQRRRLLLFLPAGVIGGLLGGYLLLRTGEKLFRELVPFLILAASLLLAAGPPLRAWVARRTGKQNSGEVSAWAVLPVGLAAIYGGYFGAGVSVIFLSVLGLLSSDSLTRLNALKQVIAFSANLAAAVFFLFSGQVVWTVALLMAVCALLGGALGGRLAGRISPVLLRWLVVGIGVIVAIIYWVR